MTQLLKENNMNLTKALNILRHYQLWRLGEEITELNPKQITEAINVVIEGAKWQQEQEKKLNSLNLDELESKLDNSLSKETTESLTEWLDSKSVDDDELTDDEWVIKELKKEIESLYTKEQMQEAILQILEYVVEKMGKKEKMNTREKSKEIIESFKK